MLMSCLFKLFVYVRMHMDEHEVCVCVRVCVCVDQLRFMATSVPCEQFYVELRCFSVVSHVLWMCCGNAGLHGPLPLVATMSA